MINGRSDDAVSNRLTFVARVRFAIECCDIWFDYVPSASNMADLPTRLDDAAFKRLERVARRVPLYLPSPGVVSHVSLLPAWRYLGAILPSAL